MCDKVDVIQLWNKILPRLLSGLAAVSIALIPVGALARPSVSDSAQLRVSVIIPPRTATPATMNVIVDDSDTGKKYSARRRVCIHGGVEGPVRLAAADQPFTLRSISGEQVPYRLSFRNPTTRQFLSDFRPGDRSATFSIVKGETYCDPRYSPFIRFEIPPHAGRRSGDGLHGVLYLSIEAE